MSEEQYSLLAEKAGKRAVFNYLSKIAACVVSGLLLSTLGATPGYWYFLLGITVIYLVEIFSKVFHLIVGDYGYCPEEFTDVLDYISIEKKDENDKQNP